MVLVHFYMLTIQHLNHTFCLLKSPGAIISGEYYLSSAGISLESFKGCGLNPGLNIVVGGAVHQLVDQRVFQVPHVTDTLQDGYDLKEEKVFQK